MWHAKLEKRGAPGLFIYDNQPPLEGPFGGALKKVYVAVTSGHISHGCLAGAQWAALGGVGRCAVRVRHA